MRATEPFDPYNSSDPRVFNTLKRIGPLLIRHTKNARYARVLNACILAYLHSGPDPNRP